MDTKQLLDKFVQEYETPAFIKSDPIQFPHRYKKKEDIEVSGLIASAFAYGRRESFIQVLNIIFNIMDNKPYEFCLNFDYERDKKVFSSINYRYTTENDIVLFINSISCALKSYRSLESLFTEGFLKNDGDIKQSISFFVDSLIHFAPHSENLRGLKFLLPNPQKGSACKRLNLYLRWMVRKGHVDLGIWSNIPTDKLIIPLDTHVGRISRKLKLTKRTDNSWRTAEEITARLREFDSNDPVKYDFALFGYGVAQK